jgi:hypothetical protein
LAVAVARKSPGIPWYLDGVNLPNPTPLIPNQTDPLLNNLPLRIGDSYPSGTSFDGSLDELRTFNRALTAAEVQAIFNAGSSGQHAVG